MAAALAAAATVAAEEPVPLPDAELLEFLAEWQTDDGEWTDPLALDDQPDEQRSEETDGEDETD